MPLVLLGPFNFSYTRTFNFSSAGNINFSPAGTFLHLNAISYVFSSPGTMFHWDLLALAISYAFSSAGTFNLSSDL